MQTYPSSGGITWAGKIIGTLGVAGYVILGHTSATFDGIPVVGTRSFAFRTDLNGNFIWGRLYGDTVTPFTTDWLKHVQQTVDGFVFSGFTESLGVGNSPDTWMVKTDALGFSGCHERPISPGQQIPPFTIGNGMQDTQIVISSNIPSYTIFSYLSVPPTASFCFSGPIITSLTLDDAKGYSAVFPNPSSGIIHFNLPNEVDFANWELLDIRLSVVEHGNVLPGFQSIAISPSLPNAVYFFRLQTERDTHIFKIILNR